MRRSQALDGGIDESAQRLPEESKARMGKSCMGKSRNLRILTAVVLWAALTGAAAQRPVTLADVASPAPFPPGRVSSAITWSPDGGRFVLNERNTLSIYDVQSGKTRQ